ncbi:branched-chain amino acid ABC transporter permease [Salinibacterium sp. ZJ450]|uniref:branched-chain amino acid ABC transporter permease n=1 Tax=Salinibacterium sp. ZJ450 TaxID=2708338 RepID=UPI001423B688|nr:branched-chain amino acid ABC transporter permease [Salinibacterium sp. ZJ450]
MNFDAGPQLLVNGLIDGSLYALAAISFGLIFSTTKMFHFAHAISFVVGAYAAVVLAGPLPLALATVVGMIVAGLFGVLVEISIYRNLRRRHAGVLQIFLAALGVLAVGEALIWIGWGPGAQRIQGVPTEQFSWGPVGFTMVDVIVIAVSWVAVLLVLYVLHSTRVGIMVRGVAANPRLSSVVGVDPQHIFIGVFFVGSALAGLSGVLFAVGDVATPTMGLNLVLAAAIGVFIGGIGSIPGAALGGLTLGLAESIGGLFLPGYLNSIVAFGLLFAVLIFKPSGFFGRRLTLSGRGV